MSATRAGEAYAAAGVKYESIDPIKRLAQEAARATAPHAAHRGMPELPASRGESAFILDAGAFYLATLTEGLGTKSLVADAVRAVTSHSHYDLVARDTVATILNDLATVGAAPLVVSAFWGAGSSAWFEDEERASDLVRGWADACAEAGATWGGGETQALAGIVGDGVAVLAGAATGVIRPKQRLLAGDRLRPGDALLIAPSTGIHANGLTLARHVAARLPHGYETLVPGDRANRGYGEVLLDPSPLYGPLVEVLQDAGVDLHYAAHVTGHGWRKLMRADRDLTYVVDRLPPVPPVLEFLCEHTGMTPAGAYGTFNMGAGYAFYLPNAEVPAAQRTAAAHGLPLLHAGYVEDGPRRVIIRPLDVTFEAESLRLR